MKAIWLYGLTVLALLGQGHAATLAAEPAPVELRLIGEGSVETNCHVALSSGCAITATASPDGTGIVTPGEFLIRADTGGPLSSNGSTITPQGICAPASGRGVLTDGDGDALEFTHAGTVCEGAEAGSPYIYDAAFRITGGTGPHAGLRGAGFLAASFTRFEHEPSNAATFEMHGTLR